MLRRFARSVAVQIIRGRSRFEPREVVLVYAWPDFERKMRALQQLLTANGIPSRVVQATRGWNIERVRASRNLHIGLWNAFPEAALPERYVFYNAEPMRLERWRSAPRLAAMRRAHEVWDYWTHNDPWLTAVGLVARIVPFGYSPHYEQLFQQHVGSRPEPDFDVLFYGSETPRRKTILAELEASGCQVVRVNEQNPAYGADLTRLIARARIVLSPFSHDEPEAHTPDFARLDLLLSNRVCVLHEKPAVADSCYGFEDHVLTATRERLIESCLELLAMPRRRRDAAQTSYDWYRSTLALDRLVPLRNIEALL